MAIRSTSSKVFQAVSISAGTVNECSNSTGGTFHEVKAKFILSTLRLSGELR
jgi:hypothetical protein